jgi:pimeloyl-ACP methyl ester carboxylesterase
VTTNEKSLATERARDKSIRIPTLVVWRDQDSITPVRQGRDLSGLIPMATLASRRGAGHSPAIEAPDRFNAEILSFSHRILADRP